MPEPLNGLLLIDKPAGITSAAALNRVKRLLPRGTRVGHAGTLDPFATGLLIVMIGKATRRCEDLMGAAKTYDAAIKLGATTATDDPEAPEEPYGATSTPSSPTVEAVDGAISHFIGAIEQVPPRYSAIKLSGRRACDRVRAGQDVQLKPRTVHVYRIDRLDFAWPLLRLRIECGRGTYIRAIARDLGAALGVGGYLTELRRTRIGEFDVASAPRWEELDPASIQQRLLFQRAPS